MRWTPIPLALLLTASLGAQERVVVFTNVSVVPMDRERVLDDQTVVVRGDRIAKIGPAAAICAPANAVLVDGRGKYIIPGLGEMHAHLPVPQAEQQLGAGYAERVLFLFFLKIHPGLSRETFDMLARTADSVGIRFAGHVPAAVGLDRALAARYASIDHLDGYVERLAGWSPEAGPEGFFGFLLTDRADTTLIAALARRTREGGCGTCRPRRSWTDS